jgi:hypothetical protein
VVFEWHSRFKAGRVSVEDDERSGRPNTSKMTENVKNSKTHPQRLSPNNPFARRHHWDQLWSLPVNLNRKFEHVLHCHEVCSLNVDK